MNSLVFALSTVLLSAPQAPPTGNVGKASAGNVGNVPRVNIGNFPKGNVGSFPRGNVDDYPRGNVGNYPRGNVDVDPLNPKAVPRAKGKSNADKGKDKTDADAGTKSKSKGKKGAKKSDDDPKHPDVVVPIVLGTWSSSAAAVEDLERVRARLNSISYDYQGRRAAAVNHVTHAIHILRFGRSDPNPDASFVPTGNNEVRSVSDLSLRAAQGELRAIAARLRTHSYLYGHAAAASVDRAVRALDVALRPI